jgi:15-cis-phytoene desaturase
MAPGRRAHSDRRVEWVGVAAVALLHRGDPDADCRPAHPHPREAAMPVALGSKPHVAIAGGGLAGLTCAKVLADAGYPVTLVESFTNLGGRANTYLDEDGDWIEQGLHLFLGGYSEFRKLLRDIGQRPREVLYFTDYIRFERPGGPRATFGIHPLYAPLRTLRSIFANNDYLPPRAKLALLPLVAPAVLPMMVLRELFDDRSIRTWWAQVSRSKLALDRVVTPFCRAIQFTDVDEFSAYNFLGWARNTMVRPLRARLGGYRGVREQTIFQPWAADLERRGVVIRTGVAVEEILYDPGDRSISGLRLAGGETLEADLYVVALPPWVFMPMVPPALQDHPFFADIAALPTAPAISVQMWLDRVVTELDGFTLVPDSDTPVYQDQARITYPYGGGSRLSVIVSPADDLLDWDDEALANHVKAQLGEANPEIASAEIVKVVVLKHQHHLIRPLPGAMTMRPKQVTPIPNLYLAGDWTQQTFFGSQEGAVRGGKACAQAILRATGARLLPVWLPWFSWP